MREKVHRAFQADALNEGGQRFAHKRSKDPVKVKGRKAGGRGDVFKAQGAAEVTGDVVDGPVDAIDVVQIRKI